MYYFISLSCGKKYHRYRPFIFSESSSKETLSKLVNNIVFKNSKIEVPVRKIPAISSNSIKAIKIISDPLLGNVLEVTLDSWGTRRLYDLSIYSKGLRLIFASDGQAIGVFYINKVINNGKIVFYCELSEKELDKLHNNINLYLEER